MTSAPDSPGFVRPAAGADARAIAAVHVAGWRSAYAGLLPAEMLAALDVGQRAARWRERLAELPDSMFVLVFEQAGHDQGVRVGRARPGTAAASPAWAARSTRSTWTRPTRPGARARSCSRPPPGGWPTAGFARASLWVLTENADARGFYESRGWRWDGTEHEWAYEGGSSMEVRYVTDLAPGQFGL